MGEDSAPDWVERLLEAIANGKTITAACEPEDMPSRWTVWRYREESAAFGAQLTVAMQMQGDLYAAKMVEVIKKIENGDYTPKQGQSAFNGYAYLADKLYPKLWGAKIKVEQEIKVEVKTLSFDEKSKQVVQQIPMLQPFLKAEGYEIVKIATTIDAEVIPKIEGAAQ